MPTLRADLHLHSRYSNKPTYWALRKFNCPESYTTPRRLYDIARSRGMDFVTITDHNSIDGALEIAHLPRTFISSEITAHFPENGCKVHLVVLDISPAGFREIMELRHNIHDLVAYLRREDLPHFLAHPLYAQNDKLTVEIMEKCLLLFTTFEVKNGCRSRRFNAVTKRLITSLDEDTIRRLADKHSLAPYGVTPWRKGVVGGSDDHGGLFIARAHTTVHQADSLKEFLQAVKSGSSWADGEDGGPLTMAHSMYGIANSFYKERFGGVRHTATPFVSALLNRFFDLGSERDSFVDKLRLFIRKNLPESGPGREAGFQEVLESEARRLLNDGAFTASLGEMEQNRKIFAVTSRLANRIMYLYSKRLLELPPAAGFFDYLNAVGAIGLTHLLVSPYYLAFHHQHRSKELIRELATQFPGANLNGTREKIALFTDTLDDINGVAITILRLIGIARDRGVAMTVITSGSEPPPEREGVTFFPAVGDFTLPEYPELKLNFPPILDVMDFMERGGYTHIHVSTPGSVGLLGLLVARIMDLPVAGTYHTDIPLYVRSLTDDEFLEQAAWNYMVWFYSQMNEVMVPSAGTRNQLLSHGFPAAKLRPLPRWVDTGEFTPELRTPGFWEDRGLSGGIKLLYVGRISREKSLDLLAGAFRDLVDAGADLSLAIVGDGPYRKEMAVELAGYPALLTGYLHGVELRQAYASAELFVFPSGTDTFGNVVLEAQASGLPVVVSDRGGPRELMVTGETGELFLSGSRSGLVEVLRRLTQDTVSLAHMGRSARAFALRSAPDPAATYAAILRPGTGLAQSETGPAHHEGGEEGGDVTWG